MVLKTHEDEELHRPHEDIIIQLSEIKSQTR